MHDFWNHTLDGLAVFVAGDLLRLFKLQRPVPELSVVAESFHTKPLIRILQSADRYHVLCLSRGAFRLFEGNRDALGEVGSEHVDPRAIAEALGTKRREPQQSVVKKGAGTSVFHGSHSRKDEADTETEKFFRTVDRVVIDDFSRPTGLPLILAALTENHAPFRAISHNRSLLPSGIEINPDSISIDELRDRAWRVMLPEYLARLSSLVEEFGLSKSKWQGSADLTDVAAAAVAGRVATLLVEAGRQVPGRIDQKSGAVAYENLSVPNVDDLLDDIAEIVLRKGGGVVVVPSERMPSQTGAAAIYRF
jgi:hypothetical protein